MLCGQCRKHNRYRAGSPIYRLRCCEWGYALDSDQKTSGVAMNNTAPPWLVTVVYSLIIGIVTVGFMVTSSAVRMHEPSVSTQWSKVR